MTQVNQSPLQRQMEPIRTISENSNVENRPQMYAALSVGAEGVCTIQVKEWERAVTRRVPLIIKVATSAYGVPGLGNASEVAVTDATVDKELTTDSLQMITTDATGLATVTITSAATETLYLHAQLADGTISYIDVAFVA